MKEVFADTFYFLALLNEQDIAHKTAHDFSEGYIGRLITTEWVLIEVGDALSGKSDRAKFLTLLNVLQTHPLVEIVRSSGELFDAGVNLYGHRHDKEWSLTDCLSFVVMERNGLIEALTGDRHFSQAGYVTLL